jgi:low temperature requirement protein LtrA
MTEPEHGKRVSWAELYFDLVFVFAITQVSALLHHDHSWAGCARALIVFVPIYWVWVGTSIQSNVNDMSQPLGRLAIFAVALGGLFMAMSVPHAYEDWGLLFACAYWASRLVLGARLFLGPRFALNPLTVSMFVTGPLLVVGALLDDDARTAVWLVAAALDLSTPTLFRARLRQMHFDAEHLTERFGLFVLIAIGESVVAIGAPVATQPDPDAWSLIAVATAFALSTGLWWVYFHFATDAMRHALATASVQQQVTRHVLSYGHVGFIASVIAVAVGMSEAVNHPTSPMNHGVAALLYGGCAAYLATFGYTRWMMFRQVATTRLTGAAIVLLVFPVALAVDAEVALALLAVVVAGVNIVEYRIVARRTSAAIASARGSEER